MGATRRVLVPLAVTAAMLVPAVPASAQAGTAHYDTITNAHNLTTGANKTTRTTTSAPTGAQASSTGSGSSSGGGAIPGSPSNSGCGYIDVSTTYVAADGQTMYRYHERTTWCWGYGVVASYNNGYPNPPDVITYVTNMSGVIQDRGEASTPPDYYYTYTTGAPNHSGYVAERHRWLTFTVPVEGAQAQMYPWLLERTHWDGTFTWKGYTG